MADFYGVLLDDEGASGIVRGSHSPKSVRDYSGRLLEDSAEVLLGPIAPYVPVDFNNCFLLNQCPVTEE